jgi:hypothetical protein
LTAEISVMNTIGVALAADSAVTIGRGNKIYNTANKLFALSKYHPIGIMIYGNADYLRVPWETIIKVFRKDLGKKYFNTVEEYAECFMGFLRNNKYSDITSISVEDQYILSILDLETSNIFDFLLEKIKEEVNHKSEVSDQELFNLGSSLLDEIIFEAENEDFIPGFEETDLRYLLDKFGGKIEKIVEETFENFIFSETMVSNIKYIVSNLILKRFTNSKSGVVISGFGEEELYPALVSYEIEGRINGKLKYRIQSNEKIGQSVSASIIPFAQDDMVHTFIRGIDPDIETLSSSYLNEIFEELPTEIMSQISSELKDMSIIPKLKNSLTDAFSKVYKDYNEVLNTYKQDYFTHPILGIVNSLPKDELADMAEALVNLTSFKRKVSSTIESVGGPVDVAVITKGDGFVWIKRKHYFESNKNQQFHQKYFWREENEPVISGEKFRE